LLVVKNVDRKTAIKEQKNEISIHNMNDLINNFNQLP